MLNGFDVSSTRDGYIAGRFLGYVRSKWARHLELDEQCCYAIKRLPQEGQVMCITQFDPRSTRDGTSVAVWLWGGAVMGCMSSILSWKVCSACLHWVYTPGLMKLSWTVLKGCLSKETCRPVWGVSSGRLLLGIFLGFKCWNEVVSLGLRVVFVTIAHEEPKGWALARHPSHLEPNYERRHNGLIYILSFSLITIHGKHLHYLRGVELSIPLFDSTLVYWQIDSSYIYI